MTKPTIPLQDFDGYYEQLEAFMALPEDEVERMIEDMTN